MEQDLVADCTVLKPQNVSYATNKGNLILSVEVC